MHIKHKTRPLPFELEGFVDIERLGLFLAFVSRQLHRVILQVLKFLLPTFQVIFYIWKFPAIYPTNYYYGHG
jgi:hypothetical protein